MVLRRIITSSHCIVALLCHVMASCHCVVLSYCILVVSHCHVVLCQLHRKVGEDEGEGEDGASIVICIQPCIRTHTDAVA